MTARALCAGIRLYQAFSATRPPRCRFWPTCSAYSLEALGGHGSRRGGAMALKRLIRCHPWGGHGVDPVPAPAHSRSTTAGALLVPERY